MDVSLLQAIERYSDLPAGYVQEWSESACSRADAAIVMVVAGWSGEALVAFRELSALLAREFPGLALFVCDADVPAPALERVLGQPVQGRGEMVWFRKGVATAHLLDYRSGDWREQVRRNTRRVTGTDETA